MPSPRAILADIHDLKLNPTKAHAAICASGRLKLQSGIEQVVEDIIPSIITVDEEQPTILELKPALVILESEEVEESTEEVTETVEIADVNVPLMIEEEAPITENVVDVGTTTQTIQHLTKKSKKKKK